MSVTASEAVYGQLRRAIISGELAGGTSVREADLTERLGVSRPTVRTALQRLVTDGLMESRGTKRSVVVAMLGGEATADAFEAAWTIARRAYQRGLPNLIDADLARMDEIVRQLERAREHGGLELDAVFALLSDFHATVCERCPNPQLIRLMVSLRPRLELLTRSPIGDRWHAIVDHDRDQLSAIRAGDLERAVAHFDLNWFYARSLALGDADADKPVQRRTA